MLFKKNNFITGPGGNNKLHKLTFLNAVTLSFVGTDS